MMLRLLYHCRATNHFSCVSFSLSHSMLCVFVAKDTLSRVCVRTTAGNSSTAHTSIHSIYPILWPYRREIGVYMDNCCACICSGVDRMDSIANRVREEHFVTCVRIAFVEPNQQQQQQNVVIRDESTHLIRAIHIHTVAIFHSLFPVFRFASLALCFILFSLSLSIVVVFVDINIISLPSCMYESMDDCSRHSPCILNCLYRFALALARIIAENHT